MKETKNVEEVIGRLFSRTGTVLQFSLSSLNELRKT
jgi:hypothetical protein